MKRECEGIILFYFFDVVFRAYLLERQYFCP